MSHFSSNHSLDKSAQCRCWLRFMLVPPTGPLWAAFHPTCLIFLCLVWGNIFCRCDGYHHQLMMPHATPWHFLCCTTCLHCWAIITKAFAIEAQRCAWTTVSPLFHCSSSLSHQLTPIPSHVACAIEAQRCAWTTVLPFFQCSCSLSHQQTPIHFHMLHVLVRDRCAWTTVMPFFPCSFHLEPSAVPYTLSLISIYTSIYK